MKKLIHKPQLFFFGLIPVFLIFSWWGIDKYVDLAFFSSYILVKISHWSLLCALFVALIGINYALVGWAKKKLMKLLSITHILIQMIAAFGYMFSLIMIVEQQKSVENTFNYHGVLTISFLIFLVSIIVHMFNFFMSLFRKE